MITKTINLYTVKELSEKARERAHRDYIEHNDMPLLKEDLEEALQGHLRDNDINEVSDLRLYYSLSYCQGDGLMFEGVFSWKKHIVTIKHNSAHYYHSLTASFDIVETETEEDAKEEIYQELKKIYHGICAKLEKYGYERIDDENSMEHFYQRVRGVRVDVSRERRNGKCMVTLNGEEECKECGAIVDALEIFSKGECLACHERNYREDGEMPDFQKTIQL